jgi:hypothetical protein
VPAEVASTLGGLKQLRVLKATGLEVGAEGEFSIERVP